MKLFALLFATLLPAFAFAADDACPMLNGKYSSYAAPDVRFVQFDCQKLMRLSAPRIVNGGEVFTVRRDFGLGTTPFCIEAGKCESVKMDGDLFVFTFDFDAKRVTAEHGVCVNRETTIHKEANGQLTWSLTLSACEDGFTGVMKEIYVPIPDAF